MPARPDNAWWDYMKNNDWIDPSDTEPPQVDPSEYEGERDLEAADLALELALDAAREAQAERKAALAEEVQADWHDETEPWADPEIQKGYQAALGEFIVTFNRLDAELTKLLQYVLGDVGRVELFYRVRTRNYGAKLEVLELLQLGPSMKAIHRAPIDEMRKIAAIRNFLAHAHFDQNPVDGTYELIPPKTDKKSQERHMKEEAIRKWTERAEKAAYGLRSCGVSYVFKGALGGKE